jgi:holliday junction DNA helicase RuvB
MIERSDQKPSKKKRNPDVGSAPHKTTVNIGDLTAQESDITGNILRPSQLDQYIGQTRMVSQLKLILRSAAMRQTIPEHLLFYGQPGLGKTTIAGLIAGELGLDLKIISAPSLKKVGDAVNILINLDQPSVVFIDEIHRLRTEVEETLYTAMEDKKIDIMIGKGQGVSTVRMDLQPFVLIGATTQFGKISKPLRDRFPTIFKMESYALDEMMTLVERNIAILGIQLDTQARLLVCERSRGVPRIANNILKRFVDIHTVHGMQSIDGNQALAFLTELGILEKGLTQADLTYLKALRTGSISLKTMGGVLAEETDTIEYAIEPYLIHLGFVDKDSSGRKLTLKGRSYIDTIVGERSGEQGTEVL